MVPYFQSPSLELPLGLQLNLFGVVSALGTLLGAVLAARAARRYGPGDDRPLRDVVTWAIAGGLIGGHLLHVFAYHPELLREGVGVVFRFWDGLSSMGGVLGALVAIFIYFRRRGLALTPYLDALALGAAPGWAVARVGCFLVHDHMGVKTDFFLAVAFPSGPRHDLGLYEALLLFGITALLYGLARRRRPEGFLMGVLAMTYSAARFLLDFLRADDLPFVDGRIAGLTPAQYIVVALFIAGGYLIAAGRRRAVDTLQPIL